MTAEVVPFPGVTTLDCDPDRVLESAIGQLECVVIVGVAKDGSEYFASSVADGADTLWHLQRAIHKLMKIADETER